MRSSRRSALAAGLVVLCLTMTAQAVPVFEDDFESGLGQWTGKSGGAHNGVVVNDPHRPANKCLTFLDLNTDGDMFATPPGLALNQGETYTLSLEYLGVSTPESSPDDFGGYAGLSDDLVPTAYRWIYATADLDADVPLIDDDDWHAYTFDFVWDPSFIGGVDDIVHVILMDSFISGGRAGDAYFDNILLTPEPASAALAFFAIGAGLLIRRR